MKLEPLSGLNQHKISTDSMPLEDASIVEIGLSVISTEKSGDKLKGKCLESINNVSNLSV